MFKLVKTLYSTTNAPELTVKGTDNEGVQPGMAVVRDTDGSFGYSDSATAIRYIVLASDGVVEGKVTAYMAYPNMIFQAPCSSSVAIGRYKVNNASDGVSATTTTTGGVYVIEKLSATECLCCFMI